MSFSGFISFCSDCHGISDFKIIFSDVKEWASYFVILVQWVMSHSLVRAFPQCVHSSGLCVMWCHDTHRAAGKGHAQDQLFPSLQVSPCPWKCPRALAVSRWPGARLQSCRVPSRPVLPSLTSMSSGWSFPSRMQTSLNRYFCPHTPKTVDLCGREGEGSIVGMFDFKSKDTVNAPSPLHD